MDDRSVETLAEQLAKYHRCESPIEASLLAHYIMSIRAVDPAGIQIHDQDYFDRIVAPLPTRQPFIPLLKGQMDFVVPQFKIDQYRADMLLCRFSYHCSFAQDPPASSPAEVWDEYLIRLPLVVVECDGHDFHEKTREQAARDKQRDRDMQIAGYHVLRFTGSEIFNDPRRCVATIESFFASLLQRME